MITYSKLWIMLKKRGMKRTDLLEITSSATVAKLGKNENVTTDVIAKICEFLNCQPGDIMENVTKEDLNKTVDIINQQINTMLERIQTTTGLSKEQMVEEMKKEIPMFLEALKQDKVDVFYGLRDNEAEEKPIIQTEDTDA